MSTRQAAPFGEAVARVRIIVEEAEGRAATNTVVWVQSQGDTIMKLQNLLVAFSVVGLALFSIPDQAQAGQTVANANQCVSIGSRPLLGHSGSDHTIQNRCSQDIEVMWCADGYYENASSNPGMNRSHGRNCGNGRVSDRNTAGFYYTTSRVRPGSYVDTYSGTRGGQIVYAACPAEVNGRRVMPYAGAGGSFSCRVR
ncbi:hypothetical protein [Thioalkalivibrio denitrificans]|uniref:hypothetical protein n=1 Tax=Thioalkalivibrio denitrificans TaxID=108003 RepID=UPI0009868560|nr:hypothetical protein [Thioalkalivibrio denitrificans]